ncbi:MAG: transposase [Nitrososphaeraceae archaeon]
MIYAYITNTYSSRKIEEAIKSDVRFIWLCGNW